VAVAAGRVEISNLRTVTGRRGQIVIGRKGEVGIVDDQGRVRSRLGLPYGAVLRAQNGAPVQQGEVLFEWDPYSDSVITDRGGRVQLRIYDVAGRLVRTLVDAEMPAGRDHEAIWNGLGDQDRRAGSGVYFYSLDAAGERLARKLVLMQ